MNRARKPRHEPEEIASQVRAPARDSGQAVPVQVEAPRKGRLIDLPIIEVYSDSAVKLFEAGEGRQEVRLYVDDVEAILVGGRGLTRQTGIKVKAETGWIEATVPDAELWAITANDDATANVRRQIVMKK